MDSTTTRNFKGKLDDLVVELFCDLQDGCWDDARSAMAEIRELLDVIEGSLDDN